MFFIYRLLSFKTTLTYSCFCFGGKNEIDGLRSVAYTANSFILSTVSRIILSLVVNFESDGFHNFAPFVKYKQHEKHPYRSITFRKASLQLY